MNDLYLVSGPESFLKEEFLHDLKRAIAGERNEPLDYDVFYGGHSELDLSVILNTAGFFAKNKLIVIKNVEDLTEPQKKCLLNYIKKPPFARTYLVLETSRTNLEGEFLSALKAHAKLTECNKIPVWGLTNWIYKRSALCGKKISKESAQLLLELKGNDLRSLAMELEKIACWLGESTQITSRVIEDMVGPEPVSSVFDLVNAIGRKDYQQSLSLAASLARSKKEETEIIGLIGWQFRRLWKGRRMLESKIGRANILKALKVPARFAEDFFGELNRFDIPDIKNNLKILAQADKALKTTGARRDLILEMLMVRLTSA